MRTDQSKPGCHTLFFSRNSLEAVGLLALTQNVCDHNSNTNCKIITKFLSDGLAGNELIVSQLALLSNCVTKGEQSNRWAVLTGQQSQIWKIDFPAYRAVFFILNYHKQQQNLVQSLQNWVMIPIFKVNSLSEILKVVSMSEPEFNRRCRLECILKKSNRKMEICQSRQNIEYMAVKLATKQIKQLIHHITNLLSLIGNQRVRILRRCFCGWLIAHYITQIEQTEQELVHGQYLVTRTNVELQFKYFEAWRALTANRAIHD